MSDARGTVGELWAALKAHDWAWPMSDDPRMSRQGRTVEAELLAWARELGVESTMFEAFRKWGWGKGPLPAPPADS